MSELNVTTVYDAYWKAASVGERTGVQVYLKSEADKVLAELEQKLHDAKMQADLAECAVTEYKIDCDKLKAENTQAETELDKWYAKLCRNRWRRAYAMYQYCCAANRIESDTSPSTMEAHQFWRYHTAYWSRWMKRWLKVYLEYKERIK